MQPQNKSLTTSILALLLGTAVYAGAAIINLNNYTLTPDGQNLTTTFQHTEIATLNGGTNVLPNSGTPVVYLVTSLIFGASSDAHLQVQFSTSSTTANRIGIEVQDTGLISSLGTGDGVLQAISSTTPKRTSVNLAQDVAGQTITLLIKLQYDSTFSATYDARTSFNGSQSTSDDTLMNVWINPTGSDVEGSGLTAGDMYALWNSASFSYIRQNIQNQLTPGTAGDSSITNTRIFTGADATWANALAFATIPEPSAALLGSLGILLLFRRRR